MSTVKKLLYSENPCIHFQGQEIKCGEYPENLISITNCSFFSKGNWYPQFKDDHPFIFFVVLLFKNILKQNSVILFIFEHYVSRIIHYILCVVEIWLLIFNIILKRLIYIIVCSYISIFCDCCEVFHYMSIVQFIYQFSF